MNDSITAKSWFWTTLGAMFATPALIALAVFVVDPFQHYRRPTFYRPVFENAYYSLPGLIRNYEYDAVVIGSSMAQNFRLSDIQKNLGWNAVKLTPPGCYAATANLLLKMTVEEGRASHVLFGIDYPVFAADINEHRTRLPMYLYDKNPWNDVKYLWNKDVLTGAMVDVVKSNLGTREKDRLRTNSNLMWAWDLGNGKREYGLDIVQENESDHPLDLTPFAQASLEHLTKNFRVNVLAPMKQNPDTDFVIFLPPYSILFWKYAEDTECLEKMIRFKALMVEELAALPNVRIADFQTEEEVIADFANYKDSSHFSPEISRWILECIGAGENIVEAVDVQAELKFFKRIVSRN